MNKKFLEFLFQEKFKLKEHQSNITASSYAIEDTIQSKQRHEDECIFTVNALEKLDLYIDEYLRLHK